MNDAGLDSVLLTKPSSRSPIIFSQNIFYCLVALNYFLVFPLHSLIHLILGLTSLDHTKKFHPESVSKLYVRPFVWRIQGSFLSGQLFHPLWILTHLLSGVNCAEADVSNSQAVPEAICHCVHFQGEFFVGLTHRADQDTQNSSTVFRCFCLQIPRSLQCKRFISNTHTWKLVAFSTQFVSPKLHRLNH